MTTKESVHYLKTMEKFPYGRQGEDVFGSGHRQQPAILLRMQGGEAEIRLYLIKEKQALRYRQVVKWKWLSRITLLVFRHSNVSDAIISSLNEVLAL